MRPHSSDTETVHATPRRVLREVNERIRSLADVHEVPDAGSTRFLCECGADGCFEIIELSVDEYEQVRVEPQLVLVASGHEGADEQIVRKTDRFWVVETRPHEPSAANLEVVMEELRLRVQTIHGELAARADAANSGKPVQAVPELGL